ncbi:MAG: Maf family nucleotide pyrophosphatase [Muribaculaceae bacterium]|nr:Maf family nucleotide pyrophosphatase [Muribaculaceae bacterium]
MDKYDVVLASGSPRRRELLKMLDIDFTVDTSHPVDETVPSGMTPEDIPAYLSQLKADAYPLELDDRRLVIAADTVVILDGVVLGKPASLMEATDMLAMLQGKTQAVITGVTVRTATSRQTWSVETEVDFAPLTPDEIAYYVETYTPLDKAGAYGIQEWIGAAAISSIRGSFYNVMGLPVHRLYQALKDMD